MSRKLLSSIIFLGILILFVSGCGAPSAPPAPPPKPTTVSLATGKIVLGVISGDPAKSIKSFQPLADYLATHLGEFGIGVGAVKVAPDVQTMTNWLKSGDVDLFFESPYVAMLVSDQAGAQPILRRWKGGIAEYNAVIFTRADSGLASLSDLKGHMMAAEGPDSTSAYLQPVAYLITAGMNPVEKPEPTSAVMKDEAGFVFSGADENTIQWVITGKVAAGAVNKPTYLEIPEETRAALTILAETEALPRHIVLARSGMEAALLKAVKTLLLSMGDTAETKAILQQCEKTAKFDEFPSEAATARMRELYQLVQSKSK